MSSPESESVLWCEHAWLGGDSFDSGVVLRIAEDRIAAIENSPVAPSGSTVLRGVVLPGLVNAHSHAFQRALRGRTHVGGGSFWTWRDQMYDLASALTPDTYHRLARATFAEMALAGITLVGEFHYVHHGPGGRPYEDPNAMGEALIEAAREAGVRLTLIDVCFLRGGVDRKAEGPQRRFVDASADAWAERVEQLTAGSATRIAGAIHSVRTVAPEEMRVVADAAEARSMQLHAHVSEQPIENEECVAAYGLTPTGLLSTVGAVSSRFTAVHCTHVAEADARVLGAAGAGCCLCPTTERDLGDGIGPGRLLRAAGVSLGLGTDSNAMIDLLEEARAVELDERLATGERGIHDSAGLLAAATAGGAARLGWDGAGRIERGGLADLVVVGLSSTRLAGAPLQLGPAGVLFAATSSDVRDVMVGGRWIVQDCRHVAVDAARELREAVASVF